MSPTTNMEPLSSLARLEGEQRARSAALLAASPTLGDRIESRVLPFRVNPETDPFTPALGVTLSALEKSAASIAIRSLISLAKAGDIDHLGGGLELIPSLLLTLGAVDYDKRHFAIEHGHTSIGYYAALAALGFLPEERVIESFRRSLDIAGHVSWIPGGTPIGSGRLGVTIPVATGLALGLKARKGADSLVICHCGDAGWISGQALNGMVGASLHGAPLVMVMHRNGIQLSGTTRKIMAKDPRPIVASLGIEILEITSLHDHAELVGAYKAAFGHARAGKPVLIYPRGLESGGGKAVTVKTLAESYGIQGDVKKFAAKNNVALDTPIWIPGSLMSFRDVHAMTECVFYVNGLAGGEAHHDGGMKGRDGAAVLANPMLQMTAEETAALAALRAMPPRVVITEGRPAKGSTNLPLTADDVQNIELPGAGKVVSPRAGSEPAYAAVAKKYPKDCFFVSCDLNPSTKLGKAAALVPPGQSLEMSIQELAAALMIDGISMTGNGPQLNVFATFSAFIEGIAREGLDLWRYQRNLNGVNEGLNVVMHLSHVGACTGRDHFSGWSLDWLNLALGYAPFLRRIYAPADARNAFLAVKDAAAAMGGAIVAIPRDNLPVLAKQDSSEALWNPAEEWAPVTTFRKRSGARVAILSIGAPSYLAGQASDSVAESTPSDVYIINGFPLPSDFITELRKTYRRIITIEDGLIGTVDSGLRGLAGYMASRLYGSNATLDHFGITDPGVAPSEHFFQVWEHYGMTASKLAESIERK